MRNNPVTSGSADVSFAHGTADRAAVIYIRVVLVLTLVIALASFVRTRAQGTDNIAVWIFAVPFTLTLIRPRLGLLSAIALSTITPAAHLQLNALIGTRLYAWAFPGVDACLGFLLGWSFKGYWPQLRVAALTFPAGLVVLLHSWIALSTLVGIARNVWQSASEFSIRGLAYNVWLTRGISWLDDYYALQDLFFYSAGLAMLFAVWAMLLRDGRRLLRQIALAVLAGAALNATFAVWQRLTGLGWADGEISMSVSAMWPDLHSFGAFMALAVFIGYGFLSTQKAASVTRGAVGLAMTLSAVGLVLSTSRATLLMVLLATILWAGVTARRLSGWRRSLPLVAVLAAVISLAWAFESGYRAYPFEHMVTRFKQIGVAALNSALSHRPEIWSAAIEMYLSFPLFGLGQGSFYRLSGLASFSPSDELRALGGSGAHNYFLQSFVELGPMAAIVAGLIAVPSLRLGRDNFRMLSFIALLGIAIGNVYAHSLLVRETLLLCAIFLGVYFWEADSLGSARWRPVTPATKRVAVWLAGALALGCVFEVSHSFHRVPFTYGRLCFEEAKPIFKDGWTSGRLTQPIPLAAERVRLSVDADRPDVERRPLAAHVSVTADSKTDLDSHELLFSQLKAAPETVILELPDVGGKRFLDVQLSHCYVPLNLGLTYDPRRLGVHVQDLRFLTRYGIALD